LLGDGEAVDNELVDDDIESESQGALAQDSCISPGASYKIPYNGNCSQKTILFLEYLQIFSC